MSSIINMFRWVLLAFISISSCKSMKSLPQSFISTSAKPSLTSIAPIIQKQEVLIARKNANQMQTRSHFVPLSIASICAGLLLCTQPSTASMIPTSINNAISTASLSDNGLVQSFLLIFISEIGDKTFFIAGLLAAKYGRLISFTGSIGALIVMTVLSTILGQLFHAVPTSLTQGVPYDDYIAVAAFTYFGIKTLLDASKLSDGDSSGMEEEKKEAEEIVQEVSSTHKRNNAIAAISQTFSLVFAAEIGDRSFLSTIALSAALNPVSVATGAIVAHGSATGLAVVGGSLLSKYLSEKVIGYIGGSLFIIFAITTALGVF